MFEWRLIRVSIIKILSVFECHVPTSVESGIKDKNYSLNEEIRPI